MRKLITWLTGLLGIAALARMLSRRSERTPVPAPEADPADELRRKLAETREAEQPAEVREDVPDATSIEERRAQVHARAQDALGLMREDESTQAGDGDDAA